MLWTLSCCCFRLCCVPQHAARCACSACIGAVCALHAHGAVCACNERASAAVLAGAVRRAAQAPTRCWRRWRRATAVVESLRKAAAAAGNPPRRPLRPRGRGSPRRSPPQKAPSLPGSAQRPEAGPAEPCLSGSLLEFEELPAALPAGGTKAGPAAAGLAAAGGALDGSGARASLWAGQLLGAALGRRHGSTPFGLRALRATTVLLRTRVPPVRLCACVRVPGVAVLAAPCAHGTVYLNPPETQTNPETHPEPTQALSECHSP